MSGEFDDIPAPVADPAAEDAPGRVDLAALDETVEIDPALFDPVGDEPVFARRVLTTPFHLNVARESATNLWTHWNGYTVADVLGDPDEEYTALRDAAALIDISPLVKYRISGRDAMRYLARFAAGCVRELAVGGVARIVFCEDRGFVVGDGFLFRLGAEEFRLVTEEAHLAWLMDSALGFRVRIEDVSTTLAALSLEGPSSQVILAEAGFAGIDALEPMSARWFDFSSMPVYVSRAGLSGGNGYELWIDPEDAPSLWIRLQRKGMDAGLRAGGFALRELSRIEAGRARAGRDYFGAFSALDDAAASTPFELGLGGLVDLDGGFFTGRDALRGLKDAAPRHFIAGVTVEFDRRVAFNAIRAGAATVGVATSIGFAGPSGINFAIAALRPEAAGGAALHVEVEIREGFALRRLILPARLAPRPLAEEMSAGATESPRGVVSSPE